MISSKVKLTQIFGTAVSLCLYNRYVVTKSYKLQISDVPPPLRTPRKHASSMLPRRHLASLGGWGGEGTSPEVGMTLESGSEWHWAIYPPSKDWKIQDSRLESGWKRHWPKYPSSKFKIGIRVRATLGDVCPPPKLKVGIRVKVTLGIVPSPPKIQDGWLRFDYGSSGFNSDG